MAPLHLVDTWVTCDQSLAVLVSQTGLCPRREGVATAVGQSSPTGACFHLAFQKQPSAGSAYRPFPGVPYLPQRKFPVRCWECMLQVGDLPLKVPSSLQCPGAEGLCLSSFPSNRPVSRARKTHCPCPKDVESSSWPGGCPGLTVASLVWNEYAVSEVGAVNETLPS